MDDRRGVVKNIFPVVFQEKSWNIINQDLRVLSINNKYQFVKPAADILSPGHVHLSTLPHLKLISDRGQQISVSEHDEKLLTS